MNEYFTLYAEFPNDEETDGILPKIDSAWVVAMAMAHPAYAEPSTHASILLREKLVNICYSGINTYLITLCTEDDEYVRIYKNTY